MKSFVFPQGSYPISCDTMHLYIQYYRAISTTKNRYYHGKVSETFCHMKQVTEKICIKLSNLLLSIHTTHTELHSKVTKLVHHQIAVSEDPQEGQMEWQLGSGEFHYFLYIFLLIDPREIYFKREKHLLLYFLEAEPKKNILVQVVSVGRSSARQAWKEAGNME